MIGEMDNSGTRCFWCNADPEEAGAKFEGPHATWCPHYSLPEQQPRWPALADVETVTVDVSPKQYFELRALAATYSSRQIEASEYVDLAKRIVPEIEPWKHYVINVIK